MDRVASEIPFAQSEGRTSVNTGELARKNLFLLFAGLVLAWLPALIGRGAIQSAAALFPLASSAHPYFVPQHAGLLYLWAPLVVLSALVLFLSPGLLLALALGAAKSLESWLLYGFGLSLVVVSAAAALVQAILGEPLRGAAFALTVIACSLACFGVLLLAHTRGRAVSWPLSRPQTAATLISIVVVLLVIQVVLVPKFYWENFNGDGAHSFEASRLLLHQPLPFWPSSAGDVASFPGLTSALFTFPAAWFIRLFGEVEASARLPYLLYLAVLFAAIVILVEWGRAKPLGRVERGLIWLGLGVYTLALAYSATYNPYAADLALPATQDTLLMVVFLGFILAFLQREISWSLFFLLLTLLASPNGMIMIAFWLLAVILVERPIPWKAAIGSGVAVVGFLAFSFVSPRIFALLHQPAPGQEYGFVGLLARFAFLQFTDWHRLLYLAIPAGILPALFLLAWKRQDLLARTFTLFTAIYFFFFYFQAFISLHYFVPVMITPLIVFWRGAWIREHRQSWKLALVGVTATAALLLSLPQSFALDTSGRAVGSAIDDRLPGYESMQPLVFQGSQLFNQLFPYDWDPRVPAESYGGSPLVWNYYTHHKPADASPADYILQLASDPSPSGTKLLATQGDVSLYLSNEAAWEAHKALRPPSPAGSLVYTVPRGILFHSVAMTSGPRIFSVVDILEKRGVNLEPVLQRLGVKR